MSAYIVRGLSVPARSLRLSRLRQSLSKRTSVADKLFITVQDNGPAQLWATISGQNALATLWRSYLDKVRELLQQLVVAMLGKQYANKIEDIARRAIGGDKDAKCMLSVYLSAIADSIAYMLRYPLYRDPLLTLIERAGAREKPVLAPHSALLVARLSLATKILANNNCNVLREKERAVIDAVDTLLGYESGVEQRIAKIVSRTLSSSISEELEALLYAAPADTRPGLNTASLLLHLLMVSAGAATAVYALTGSTGFEENPCLDAPVARLAGLLHDIGKPIDPRNHVKASVVEAERLLEGLVPRGILDAVKELIRSHHGEASEKLPEALSKELYCLSAEKLHAALRCSDQTFTALDRLSRIILAIAEGGLDDVEEDVKPFVQAAKERLLALGEKLSERTGLEPLEALRELYFGRHPGVREAFFELLGTQDGAEIVAEATEALAKLLARPRSPKLEEKIKAVLGEAKSSLPQPCRALGPRPVFGLAVIDIGGIQKGISESFKLRSMAGFSLLVDYLTMSIAPYSIVLNGSPPEAVVFTGGGTVQAIVPLPPSRDDSEKEAAKSIRDTISEIISSKPLYDLSLSGVKIRVSVKRLEEPLYSETVLKAYQRMPSEEASHASVEAWLATLLSNLAEPCESCGIRPRVVDVGGERYCPVCAARYAVTQQLGYSYDKYEGLGGYRGVVLGFVLGEVESRNLAEHYLTSDGGLDVLALIAREFSRNYAIIKSDGNVAGMFMSSSITPTMYFERSIRLDMATKNTIAWIFDEVWSIAHGASSLEAEYAREVLAALVLGYMYAGGDDSLLIVPADLALPLAMMIVYGFSAEMGFVMTLSTGVVGAPVKHNIWWSIDAATALLDEVAKSEARPVSVAALLEARPAPVAGFVAFDYTDGWGLNSHRALRRHEYLDKRGLTLQPLPLLSTDNKPGLLELVSYLTSTSVGETRLPETMREDKILERSLRGLFEKYLDGTATDAVKELYKVLAKYIPTRAQELVLSGNAVARSAGFSEILLALSYAASRLDKKLDKKRRREQFTHRHMHQEEGEQHKEQPQGVKGLVKVLIEKLDGRIVPLHDIYLVYKFARGD